ncbi:MAG: DEAD/DEAH box helicase [Candidatus Eisenbacteria bacterium]|uniref:DEAD/DEAH box helicase n=1 Tax=Eiseniibacteriota bacterium TaxID=2212470 RepID=A0A948RVH3_UNCEI|nr:DEAD/DEAH box helicase [Candidatus Eisenbacteria bacterium]MBU1951056.1 DEAD/DEAH box helicase [Candidatus Eisenbacteria bacterium]MBU2691773.1 DEAD/DEAH box helicase [Candidatus Eisenbacteria bacterium]
MSLNPIIFSERVLRSFLRYQLTAYHFADEGLHSQMRSLLSLDETRQSPLMKGPYVSLSRPFRRGAKVVDLIGRGIFHPHMRHLIPEEITHIYGHQEDATRAIHEGKTTLISTGTGSGKTECFLWPIVSRCLEIKEAKAKPGISAVICYPMNALAEDQLGRLRGMLAGTGITFGMYVGKTPETESEVTGIRLPMGSSHADYIAKLEELRDEKRPDSVYPPEEVCSREEMRKPGGQPRILLTNVNQLELLLTRQRDVELFADARLDYLVFDEAHTFTGAKGAETACLIRRLRSFCGREESDTVCVATSATIVDKENPEAARDFASRFFGVPKSDVQTVGEAYEPELWEGKRSIPPAPKKDPNEILSACVEAVDKGEGTDAAIRAVYRDLAGSELPAGDWSVALYESLSQNEIVFRLTELLAEPWNLNQLPEELAKHVGRPVCEAEILSWLTLGAAARIEERPLLRPVVHGFIRGISGAVVSFAEDADDPHLWLAAEDEIAAAQGESQSHHFPVMTCTTCGQHYFVAFLKDFEFYAGGLGGGDASEGSHSWEPLAEAQGGRRVVLTDRIVGGTDDEAIEESDQTAELHFCRGCGAAFPGSVTRCIYCSSVGQSVRLFAIRQKEDNPGNLTRCISCGSTGSHIGGRYREPARTVRATNVADVHILAQDMIHHSERPRLLVFCDNRQDAAFQAGWMKDHARRFRLRALMAEGLKQGPMSVGDLVHYLDDVLNKDEVLSRALVPEVWLVARKEGKGGRHEQERRKFLRFQVLREVTMTGRQTVGLEPWGRMRVEYEGLNASLPWIQDHANQLRLPAEHLREGVASLLDILRRRRILFDPEYQVFTKYWQEGDQELQYGYLPQTWGPIGTKLQRGLAEEGRYIVQWITSRGQTTMHQIVRKWGVEVTDVADFLESLFEFLRKLELLKPVRLTGAKGKPLPGLSGLYQVDADHLRLQGNHGVWCCQTCRRRSIRNTPHSRCPAYRCEGVLAYLPEDPDNYDLQILDQGYSMLRPEEHTAMVPHEDRERLENLFKGTSDAVNCFVCTPTLELGVDIGALDAILMRNVPPLPANYWQRAGRAGRRHRMAVDMTYCRPVSHDRAYFADPLKLLSGRVDPPAFNLSNDLMVAKHVHASVITRLHQYSRDERRSFEDRERIAGILRDCIPNRVTHYLFDSGLIRKTPLDISGLKHLINENMDDLVDYVDRAFRQGWPEADKEVVTPQALRGHVESTTEGLSAVLDRLQRRLRWAMEQIRRLNKLREEQGDLEPEDDALFRRCDRVVRRLKGTDRRRRREAEGFEDVHTYSVLAAEGFLPGYGLEVGSILGSAEIPFWRDGARDLALPRPPSVALREYVPGNLIYANGHRFVARQFHREVDEHRMEMPSYEISMERRAVRQIGTGVDPGALGAMVLPAISVCDVDLVHQSHISDEEEFRFQMPVSVFGLERGEHRGGKAFSWGKQDVHVRKGVRLRLVNVGATREIERSQRIGYPVCIVCGQSVSPSSSDRQREHFASSHQDRCGRPVESVGFYTDVVADALSLVSCENPTVAYSVLEALRTAAARILDMHQEDLQILVIGHLDREEVDAYLWDPMPGGSGLLEQFCGRFGEIVEAAREIVAGCPSNCDTSCIDCLQTFRNAFFHKHLDRRVALEKFDEWGSGLAFGHEIPATGGSAVKVIEDGAYTVNEAERKLRHLLLGAGFEDGVRGEQIILDRATGSTTPDVIYRADYHEENEGICIYLDGLSEHLHGNPITAEKDRAIRTWLRNHGYEVIEIAVTDLDDRGAMTTHFKRLAGFLREDDIRKALPEDSLWFKRACEAASENREFSLKRVYPSAAEKYVECVPLVPLEVAAGGFGESQNVADGEWEWVEVKTSRKLRAGMFVAQVVGRSMEPRIPDGSYCLFSGPVTGTRQGKIVLVQLRDQVDPETGARYTVKQYESEKSAGDEGPWRHIKITLKPLNPSFEPICLTCEDEGQVAVVAELAEVLGKV